MTQTLEQEIQAKGLIAPRITPADLENAIASTYYFTAADGVLGASAMRTSSPDADRLELITFCVLVLKNGFTVVGQSACVSAANFNKEIGEKVARQNAIDSMWPLLGYALQERLYASQE